MTRSPASTPRRTWACLGAWALAGAVLQLARGPLFDRLFLLSEFIHLGHFVWGCGLLISLLWPALRRGPVAAPAVGALVLAGVALAVAQPTAMRAGLLIDFLLHRDAFDRAVAAALKDPGASKRHDRTEAQPWWRVIVDPGPPARVAFDLGGGVADNWIGVIYDPSGAVAAARGWRARAGDFTAPPQVRELFGADIVGCMHLTGAYYRCNFT